MPGPGPFLSPDYETLAGFPVLYIHWKANRPFRIIRVRELIFLLIGNLYCIILINKSKSLISVTNREKLLEKLTEGYLSSTERKSRETYRFATESSQKLFLSFYERQIDYVACGFYAAQIKGLAVTDQITIFVKDIEQAKMAAKKDLIRITPDTEFGNVNITETKDPGVWFNAPSQIYDSVVDNIELYLEMMTDTPRGPKIAELLKQRILKGDAG